MNKEQEELLDVAHKNYVDQTMFSSDPTWFKAVPCMDRMRGELKIGYRQYAKEEFINKCKPDSEFSEKWGLTIEERELSLEERYDWFTKTYNKNLTRSTNQYDMEDILNTNNIPTKSITITYNDKTIESYG
jgi:hypothetical protein